MKYIMVPALCLMSSVAVANECNYKTDTSASFEGVISKSKNYDKKTYPYIKETRKCVVSLDVKIKDKWYPTSGSYIFSPSMAESEACKNAEVVAKEDILRTTVPEKLNKKTEQKCNVVVGEKPKAVEPPKPPAVPTIPVQIDPLINQNGSTQQNSGGFLNRVFQVDRVQYTPTCKRLYMDVWIAGVRRAAWKEICK
jgi:hypothetical protein|tara:strand:- start:229 stop:816 length:588 start_codon:yes stop_codon:yes gene_type:complete